MAVLLGLFLVDGIRNWTPDEERTTVVASAPETVEDVAASFPRTFDRTDQTARREECAARAAGPAAIPPRPVGDRDRWLTSIDYPLASLQAGHEGVTGMVLTIDRRGVVAGCAIASGSGDALLDAAACATLRSRARYEPARDAAGCPVAATSNQRVRWQIPLD